MQGLGMVSRDGKHFHWVLSNFLQAGDCVIAHLCAEGTFSFLQASLKQGIICVFVDSFLHLCGYYLFCMTTASEKFSDTQWKGNLLEVYLHVFSSILLSKLQACKVIVLFI